MEEDPSGEENLVSILKKYPRTLSSNYEFRFQWNNAVFNSRNFKLILWIGIWFKWLSWCFRNNRPVFHGVSGEGVWDSYIRR